MAYNEHMNNRSCVHVKGSGKLAIQDVEHCDFIHAHEELVETVRERMPEEDRLYDLAELFKVFGGQYPDPDSLCAAGGGDVRL